MQGQHARSMLHLLSETLDGVRLSSPDFPFVVADLGCSSGSNTIYMVEFIIKHMTERYKAAGYEPPEFSAFFSDLPSNDFNTLFQLLPPYGGETMEECLASDSHRSYFAAGVPGSFHGRLFPAKSVDLFYSAFSLHWLSQVVFYSDFFCRIPLRIFVFQVVSSHTRFTISNSILSPTIILSPHIMRIR